MSVRKVAKTFIENTADNAGFILIPKWRFDHLLLARRLKRIISEYQIDCILDVGANIGQYHGFLRHEVDYEGLVVSFEPDPTSISRLDELQKEDDNWVIQDYGLGKENSVLQLNIMKKTQFNSFLEPDSTNSSRFDDSNSIVEKVDVDVKRLDDVVRRLQDKYRFANVFLKMDTQGFDLDVFEGAAGCLDLIKGVQSEVSLIPIYKDMPTFEDSLRFFKSKGFEVSGLYSLSENRFPLAYEYDCVYLPKN